MPFPLRLPLVPAPFLDRLLDDHPERPLEAAPEFLFDLSRHKQAVARDVESLLNTRSPARDEQEMEAFPLARASLLTFGIPDLGGLSPLDPGDRSYLRDCLQRAIERHELRLSKVRVSLDPARELHQALRFRVDGLLRTHPSHPPVVLDATLQLSSGTCRVKG